MVRDNGIEIQIALSLHMMTIVLNYQTLKVLSKEVTLRCGRKLAASVSPEFKPGLLESTDLWTLGTNSRERHFVPSWLAAKMRRVAGAAVPCPP
jgi:hypothetical protein